MIDTNSITQATQIIQSGLTSAATIREQINPWLPAIAVAAAWLGRELTRFSVWLQTAAAKIIAHGGVGKIIGKLIWN